MATKRIIIKVGSNLLVRDSIIDLGLLDSLFREVKHLQNAGWQPFLVLSGAVASGKTLAQLKTKQASAAVGQLNLAASSWQAAEQQGVQTGLILISREDILNRKRYEILRETLLDLAEYRHVPVINENDATALTDDPDFRDNDHLATIIAMMVEAQRLILMTNVDGVYAGSDHRQRGANVIPDIPNINLEIISRLAKGKSLSGRGGMAGKLTAARIATAAGITTHIMNGADPADLTSVILNGSHVGTVCRPRSHALTDLSRRDRWLLSASNSGASIQVDAGAAIALRRRKSLLAVGVKHIFGRFTEGECVELVDTRRDTVALGLTALSSIALEKILRQREKPYNVEVVHADNLRLLE